jgi:hypothetical protein
MESRTLEGMGGVTFIKKESFSIWRRIVSKQEPIHSNKMFSFFHSFDLAISSNLTIIVHNI